MLGHDRSGESRPIGNTSPIPSVKDGSEVASERTSRSLTSHSISSFIPREVEFDYLTSDETVALLQAIYEPDGDAEFLRKLVTQLATDTPADVETLLAENPTQDEISLAEFSEVICNGSHRVSTKGHRFSHRDGVGGMSVLLIFDPEQNHFTVRLCWGDECFGYPVRDSEQFWEKVSFGAYAIDPTINTAELFVSREDLVEGKVLSIFDGVARIKLGRRAETINSLLSDPCLPVHQDLLPFAIPGRFQDRDTRVAHIHAAIVGVYPNGVKPHQAQDAAERAAVATTLVAQLTEAAHTSGLAIMESDDLLLPVTAATTPESIEASFQHLCRLRERDTQTREQAAFQEPTSVLVKAPEASKIVAILELMGIVAGQDSRMPPLAQNIRQFLFGTGEIELQTLSEIMSERVGRVGSEVHVIADAGTPAEVFHSVEFVPSESSGGPTVRVFTEPPPLEEGEIIDVYEFTDGTEDCEAEATSTYEAPVDESWRGSGVFEDELDCDPDEGPTDAIDGIEFLQPSELYLIIQWPDSNRERLTSQELERRWRLIAEIDCCMRGETVADCSAELPRAHQDEWSIRQLSEHTQVQISRAVKIPNVL